MVKNSPASAGDCESRAAGTVPGSGRAPGGGRATRPRILGWRIPRREEPEGLQSMGSHKVGHDRRDFAGSLYYVPGTRGAPLGSKKYRTPGEYGPVLKLHWELRKGFLEVTTSKPDLPDFQGRKPGDEEGSGRFSSERNSM